MRQRPALLCIAIAASLTATDTVLALPWSTVVNNGTAAPGGVPGAAFTSYNQPAINEAGVVVFRARSRAGTGTPQVEGIYSLDLFSLDPVAKLLMRGDPVPAPNNTLYNGIPASLTEFPSTPRIDPNSSMIASRAQHEPVWTYVLGGTETRVGTASIIAFPAGTPVIGASQLGAAVEADTVTLSFPWFSVPGTIFGTRFDQFPGSPAIDGDFIIYKGNYTEPTDALGRTGIFFRDVVGSMPVPFTGMIASSNMVIPNQPEGGSTLFGSTAPPSAANGSVYFTGLDIEEAPTLGGIYRAPIQSMPTLEVIASVGDQVPGEPVATTFRTFGEALSVSSDGNRVSFWATWGTQTFPKTLLCPVDGRAAIIEYCLQQHPDGLVVDVPVHQGIFVHDRVTGITRRVARTGQDGLEDFVFWGFSGRSPAEIGDGEVAEELARWRSSAFSALSVSLQGAIHVAFKAQRNGLDGIYLREATYPGLALQTVVEVDTTAGTELDPDAPAGSVVSAVGIERDGFRATRMVITASMLYVDPLDPEISLGWAGIYQAPVPTNAIFQDGFE